MNLKRILLGLVILIAVSIGVFFNWGAQPSTLPCELVNFQMATGNLHFVNFRHYKEMNGSYPKSLDELRLFMDKQYDEDDIEIFEERIKDPYTRADYIYFPFVKDGFAYDYVLYSLGPDKVDNNLAVLEKINSGELKSAEFKVLNNECDNLNKIRNQGDLLVRLPSQALKNEILTLKIIEE
jgi:hypothetical protein